MDSKKKSLMKTITWRITASLTTLLLVYAFSREIKLAGTIALLEVCLKMVIYYFHERIWENFKADIYEDYTNYNKI